MTRPDLYEFATRAPFRILRITGIQGMDRVKLHEVLGKICEAVLDHVVEEQVHELIPVLGLQQVGKGAGGQSLERLVGRGEDGELLVFRERVDEAGGLERGDERGELRRGSGNVDDGLAGRSRSRSRRGRAPRHEHRVDDVHDSIIRAIVGEQDFGAVDEDGLAEVLWCGGGCHGSNLHALALHRLDHLHVLQLRRLIANIVTVNSVAKGHVVGEQVHELRLVLGLEEVRKGAGGQSGERLVARGEDGER